MQHVADNLSPHPRFKLHKFTNRGHFTDRIEFTELRDVVLARIKAHAGGNATE